MNTQVYRVIWEVDIVAPNERKAAEKALAIQHAKGDARFFRVAPWKENNPGTAFSNVDLEVAS